MAHIHAAESKVKLFTHFYLVYNAGELPADWRAGYVTNSSMAMLAEELNGIVIVMEHRCYGESMVAEVCMTCTHKRDQP